jgi:DHA1 family bicyclomycin/chloramphenicol resistance-like MFS transporter
VSRENAASRRARTTPGHLPANSPWPLRERKPRAGWPDAGATRTVYADGYGTTTSDSVYRPAPSSPFRPSEPDIDSYPSTPSGRELSRWFVASLGLLIAISALSIDIVLPAIPAIAREFGVGERSAQYLVTAYLSGFAIGQLPIGLLADRSGRRVVIICALALFIVAGIGAAAATSVPAICGARFVQGLGGACGPVLARAIVRDVGGADHGARLMAMMMAILGLAPLLAPLLGGALVQTIGWQWPLIAIPLYGAVTLAAVLLHVPETHRQRLHEKLLTQVARSVGELLASPAALLGVALVCLPFAGYMAMITTSSTVLIGVYGLSPFQFGAIFAAAAAAYSVGAACSRTWLKTRSPKHVLDIGMTILTVSALLLSAAWVLAQPPLWFFWSGVTVFVFGLSVSSPVATSIALAPLPGSAGFAASILGAASIATGALGSLASAAFYANDENSMTAVLLLGISGALVLWRVYGRHL